MICVCCSLQTDTNALVEVSPNLKQTSITAPDEHDFAESDFVATSSSCTFDAETSKYYVTRSETNQCSLEGPTVRENIEKDNNCSCLHNSDQVGLQEFIDRVNDKSEIKNDNSELDSMYYINENGQVPSVKTSEDSQLSPLANATSSSSDSLISLSVVKPPSTQLSQDSPVHALTVNSQNHSIPSLPESSSSVIKNSETSYSKSVEVAEGQNHGTFPNQPPSPVSVVNFVCEKIYVLIVIVNAVL